MGVKILSLFDGMACGMIAMQLAGVEVESYDAYEIDKYAIKTAQHNFPMIIEHGDVFDADFTQYEGVDFLIGGSPCTYWSIAQTKNRETVASGMGWELFSQYVRALHEAKPKYFIYENNKSMSKQIRASIDEAFGFEAVLINSALVSAQNRQRLYWVGRRNADGTYSKVNVEQPADRGILLKDVLDNAVAMREKAHAVIASAGRTTEREFFVKNQGNMAAEPVNTDANGKAFCVTSRYYKGFGNNPGKCLEKHRDSMVAESVAFSMVGDFGNRKVSVSDKAYCLAANPSSDMSARVAEPVCVAERGRVYCGQPQHYEARTDGKTNTLTSVEKDNRVAEPINVPYDCDVVITENSIRCQRRDQKHSTVQGSHVNFTDGKTQTLSPSHIPNVIERKDGKEITIYEVRDGKITIKGKQYPIKLKDGFYITRKLTVSECKRLQTVPEWYEFPVSNSQAYKMLGNGWTCEVIVHLILSCMAEQWG